MKLPLIYYTFERLQQFYASWFRLVVWTSLQFGLFLNRNHHCDDISCTYVAEWCTPGYLTWVYLSWVMSSVMVQKKKKTDSCYDSYTMKKWSHMAKAREEEEQILCIRFQICTWRLHYYYDLFYPCFFHRKKCQGDLLLKVWALQLHYRSLWINKTANFF